MIDYILHIGIMINIYFILLSSVQLLIGMSNLLTLAHAAFYGLGAYFSTYLLLAFDLDTLLILPLVFMANFSLAWLLSKPIVKLKGDFFLLITIGVQVVIFSILYNWTEVTKGPYGISSIPDGKILGFSSNANWYHFVISCLISGLTVWLTHRLITGRYGQNLMAVREDDILATSLGRNPAKFRTESFAWSAGLAASAGFIFASYVGYIDPSSFNLEESIFIMAAVLIGGLSSIRGAIVGSLFVVLLPELLRFVQLPDSVAAPLRNIIYALFLLAIMYYRPQGLLGKYVIK